MNNEKDMVDYLKKIFDTKDALAINHFSLILALSGIEKADKEGNYDYRNGLVWKAFHAATNLGYKAGVRIDPDEPEWPVVFIELPTGQVSWHVPQHDVAYDGHTTEEKYQRIKEFVE